ncbi:hypothetical protein Prudu_012777 [Prunus dulcis]|uniref:Uncharacterized protein n=1 Tax=Prunus dulcis TaxID=3755 RepID=A0A4Y1RDF8_PRUDU|nr:hypothetical protein Prudu_012777 [Prunus dulcis]
MHVVQESPRGVFLGTIYVPASGLSHNWPNYFHRWRGGCQRPPLPRSMSSMARRLSLQNT